MTEQLQQKITIIGLGLIGGSIGLALKSAGLGGFTVIGHDRARGAEKAAEKMGAIDRGEHSQPKAVAGASIVIVATPITALPEVFQQIGPDLSPGAVVTDTASTKSEVMRWAKALLPDTVAFIGGHPMAGKETPGIESAEAGLFHGRAYCIVPPVDATPEAIRQITGLARLVGAEPLYMDADEHDQYAAAVSHMPLVLSTALFTLLRESPSWDDLGNIASSGFRDMTRLASGDPLMSHGIWSTNREAIIHWLERMTAELSRYRDMLQDARDEELLRVFGEARIQRDTFIAEPPGRRYKEKSAAEETRSRALMDMFLGGMLADNLRRMQKLPEVTKELEAEREKRGEPAKKLSLADKIAEGVRRDLEKMEAESGSEDTPSDEGK